MLSILEMPNTDEWIIELVASSWKSDPKYIKEGKLKVPCNMWYIGTINNDDSTFMVTDKVYDRAMPIDINDKGEAFEAPDTPNLDLSSKYLESLFDEAKAKYDVDIQDNEDNFYSEIADLLEKMEIDITESVKKEEKLLYAEEQRAHMHSTRQHHHNRHYSKKIIMKELENQD
jgi:hypothetical protein